MTTQESVLNNPLQIQSDILSDLQSRIDGDLTVVDANNPFMFLLEAFSRTVSEAITSVDTKLNSIYPKRATTTKELYQHLSDYDYLGFFSSPANLKLRLILHRDFIVNNAIQVENTNYKLVVIPKDTVFQIGRYSFGLHYPIHIRVNNVVNTISAVHDTTEDNPLYSLNVNTIKVTNMTTSGIDLIELEFNLFQFTKQVITEIARPELGFNKSYLFNDKFYAIRVFDTTNNTELAYTLSDSVYDVSVPTVRLKVYPETNQVELKIPQVYFSTGQVGNNLKIEIYSTLGELDVSIANIRLEDIKANFALSSPNTDTTYSDLLKNIPTIIMTPANTRITGGSNGMSFDEIKDFTVYRNKATVVPISRMDMERFFDNKGFKYLVKVDNLTDRRYHAYRKLLLDSTDLDVTNGTMTLNAEEDINNSSVLYHDNNTIVVLPTAIYQLNTQSNRFSIIDDNTRNSIVNASPVLLAGMLNNDVKYCQPHHLVITTADRYPSCVAYDLLSTEADSITFLEENIHLSAQMSVVSVAIRHLKEGSGGYTIRLGLQRSDDIISVATADLEVFLTVTSTEGYMLGISGVYVATYDGIDAYDFTVSTNYKLNSEKISITNFIRSTGYVGEYEIDLEGTMHVATFIKKSYFPTIAQNFIINNRLISTSLNWLAISLQSFRYKLGSNLRDILDTNILTSWTSQNYQVYTDDVELTYEHDVYETNPNGTIVYTIDPITNEVITNKLHNAGDVVIDSVTGTPVIKHHAGDIYYDVNNNPIVISPRVKDFTIDISCFDFKHRVTIDDFLIELSVELSSYYDTIREMDESVLENTQIFFKPMSTSGTGKYKLNNLISTTTSLGLSFEFNCYVSQAIINDTAMLTMISDKVTSIIRSHLSDSIFSVIAITSDIKNQLDDYISSIDLVAMNDEASTQTLVSVETEKVPQVATKLSVNQDNRLILIPDVTINYKPLDV